MQYHRDEPEGTAIDVVKRRKILSEYKGHSKADVVLEWSRTDRKLEGNAGSGWKA